MPETIATANGTGPPPVLRVRDLSVVLQERPLVSRLDLVLHPADRLLVTADRSDSLAALAYALTGLVPSPWRLAVEASEWSRDWVQFEHRVLAGRLSCADLVLPSRPLLVPEDLDTWFVAGTGFDELAFLGWAEGDSPSLDHRLFELFDPGLLRRPIYNLSGGEKQRLALAVAIVARPDCVILLNGLGWLDRAHRGAALDALLSLGAPLVFCDDHVELLARACTRRLHLDGAGLPAEAPDVRPVAAAPVPGPARCRDPDRRPDEGLVVARHLTFVHTGFEDVCVLDDTSFSIPAVEHVFVIGPNGTGKSTLANLVCGLERQYTGSLLVWDERTGGVAPKALRERLGAGAPQILFQFVDDNLIRPTVGEYLALGVAGERGRDAGIDEWLARVDAGPGRLTTDLDTFQKKIVVLARMALTGCRIAFLDEPAWGLTTGERRRLQEFISRHLAGMTKLWITHEPESLPYAPDAIVSLGEGRVSVTGRRPVGAVSPGAMS